MSLLRIGSDPKYFVNGPELRKWRLQFQGMTLASLANKLDISAAYLSKVETTAKETHISVRLYLRIEEVCGSQEAEKL